MTPFTFDQSNTQRFKDFIVIASTDMFWEVRDLFGCSFFTPELQTALRRWIKKEHFLIRDFWPEKMQEKFGEFRVDAAEVGKPLDILVEWLARGSEGEEMQARATMNWLLTFVSLSRASAEIPAGVDRGMLRECLDMFKARYEVPMEPANAFLKSIAKEWDCYPDSIAVGQKEYNIGNKTEWDRKIYVECVLFYEMYVDVALGTPFGENCWQDFVEEYDDAFTGYQKQQFFEAVASHAIERKTVPAHGLVLPIEALLSPPTQSVEV